MDKDIGQNRAVQIIKRITMMNMQSPKEKFTAYPRMTALKSWWNLKRQTLMKSGTHWLQQRSSINRENPYLEGIFAPVTEVEQIDFELKGEIPRSLNGILLRVGPNPIQVHNPHLYHWFSGDGMIHGLRIESGTVQWFKSRYIATDSVQKNKKLTLKPGFRRGPGDVVNTNAFFHANKIWALVEAGTFPVCLDLELNTERHQLLNSDADLPFTAHPHKDPGTGHLHAICYDALDPEHIFYEVFDDRGELIHLAKISVQHGPMIHDCAMTENEVIIFDFPVTFAKDQVLKGNSIPYMWNSEHSARIGVLPKYAQAEQIMWISLDPCFVFHAANAYRENENSIVVDVVVHDRMFEQSKIGPFEQQKTQLERWTVDLTSKRVVRKVLDEQVQEFPRIDERFTGLKNRYIYSVSYDSNIMDKANQLLVHDVETGQKVVYDYGVEWLSGEVIFIAESKDSNEGQGYLMSYVHHVQAQASKVVLLKVDGIQLTLQAEIVLKHRVPLGFHANWVDLTKVDTQVE